VAKHGNRSVSSLCGSADVLEALGVAIDLGPAGVAACLAAANVGFMYAPRYHPAMKAVRPVRGALKARHRLVVAASPAPAPARSLARPRSSAGRMRRQGRPLCGPSAARPRARSHPQHPASKPQKFPLPERRASRCAPR
jgi:hypothetical protein